jgi:hypothetical protein
VLTIRMRLPATSPLVEFMNSPGGGFLAFPMLCGGLNSIITIGCVKAFVGSSKHQD